MRAAAQSPCSWDDASRLDRATGLVVGWFGPRGLASIVFGLMALEDLEGVAGPVDEVVGVIGLTVLLSVFAQQDRQELP